MKREGDKELPTDTTPFTDSDSRKYDKKPGCLKRSMGLHIGLILVLIACVGGALNAVIVKVLAGRVPALVVSFCRQLSFCLYSPVSVAYYDISPKINKKQALWLFIWIVVSTLFSCTYFFALENLPAGDAIAISLTKTFITGLLAWPLLKEKFSLLDAFFALLAVVGVVLIAKPTFIFGASAAASSNSGNTAIGVFTGLASAFFMSLSMVLMRKLGNLRVHPYLQQFYLGPIGTLLIAILVTVLEAWKTPLCGLDRIILIAIGFLSFFSSIVIKYALKLEKAANVALFSTNHVTFTFVLEFLIVGSVPSWLSLLGAGIIVLSSVAMTVNKMRSHKKSQHEPVANEEDDFDN